VVLGFNRWDLARKELRGWKARRLPGGAGGKTFYSEEKTLYAGKSRPQAWQLVASGRSRSFYSEEREEAVRRAMI
jgi:hypothetical protein